MWDVIDPLTRQADDQYPAQRDDEDVAGTDSRSGNGKPAEFDEWEPIGAATFGDAEPPDPQSRFENGNRQRAGTESGSETGKPDPPPVPVPAGVRAAGSSRGFAAAWSTSRSS
jgi:hypothetical protein